MGDASDEDDNNQEMSLETDPEVNRLIQKINDPAQGGRGEDVGKVEDYFHITEELGEGAFAHVYRGIKKNTGKEVALKIVKLKQRRVHRSDKAAAAKEKKRLRKTVAIIANEVQVLRKVAAMSPKRRKGLITLVDVIASPTEICVAMELLSGGELFDRVVAKRHYTERDAALIMKRLMRAIRHLHRASIMHRDLKPENLVFATPAEDSPIKITDFGLATIIGDRDLFKGSVVGSPGYIAPEILDKRFYTPACDIWSMGIILYILLVGGPPFGGRSDKELFDSIKSGRYGYPRSSNVSGLARDLIAKMLIVDPNFRISATDVLKHPWIVQRSASADLNNSITRLRAFNSRRKLKAVAMAFVWGNKGGLQKRLRDILSESKTHSEGFTGEELTLLRDALFKNKLDETDAKGNNTNMISQENFVRVFDMVIEENDIDLDRVFQLFDPNSTGKADVAEILVGLSTAAKTWNSATALRFSFETYEKFGTGKISSRDIQKILSVVVGEDSVQKLSVGVQHVVDRFRGEDGNFSFQQFRKQLTDPLLTSRLIAPMRTLLSRAASGMSATDSRTPTLEHDENEDLHAEAESNEQIEDDDVNHLGVKEEDMVYYDAKKEEVHTHSLLADGKDDDDDDDDDTDYEE